MGFISFCVVCVLNCLACARQLFVLCHNGVKPCVAPAPKREIHMRTTQSLNTLVDLDLGKKTATTVLVKFSRQVGGRFRGKFCCCRPGPLSIISRIESPVVQGLVNFDAA